MGRSGDSPAPPRPLSVIGVTGRRVLRGLLTVILVALGAHWVLLAAGADVPAGLSALVLSVSLAALAVARPVLVPHHRWQWGAIAGGIVLFAVARVLWAASGEPDVSAADGVWLAGMVALLVGLYGLLRPHLAQLTAVVVTDAAAGALTVTAVGMVLLDAAFSDLGSGTAVLVNLAYPLLDLTLLASVIVGAAVTGWRPGPDMSALLLGFTAGMIVDVAYMVELAQGVAPTLGPVLSPIALLLVAVAGWLPPGGALRNRVGPTRSVVGPAVIGAVALAVLVAGALHPMGTPAVGLAAAALVLVLVRGALLRLESWSLQRDLEAAEAMVATDQLTGLSSHRAFQERLADEVVRATRARVPLSVVLLDIDRFAAVNDRHGHEAGDRVLRAVAGCIRDVARQEDVVARLGGEEFAWILPGADDLAAWNAAERARQAVRDLEVSGVGRVTVSGGVADLRHAHDAPELVRLAGGALYWAKEHGRDIVCRYSTAVVRATSAEERASQLMRVQTLSAMRVLARAVDERDPYTARHSERVADLCVRIATARGWPAERIVALSEAALVHDVGKVGVPDAVLLKTGPLTDQERRLVQGHAELGAQLVGDVLDPEQVAWVRGHHERWDGGGYPDGLSGADIPDGARILAVADAWDAMTTDRPYRLGLPLGEAIERIGAGSGAHFCPEVVDAMHVLAEHGLLEPATAGA